MAAVCPWTKITVFLFAAVQVCGAQEGFVSLLCGGKSNITEAETKLVWIPDDNYTLYKGEIVLYPVEGVPPKPIRQFNIDFKSCYNLTTVKGDHYLIRGSFFNGELYGKPLFDVSIDATVIFQANTSVSALRNEVILTATGNYVTYCLIPKRHHGAPFISQLELRPLNRELYTLKDSHRILKLLTRTDLGNNGSVSLRYPNDSFDRIWDGDPHPNCGKSISSKTNFSTSDSKVPNQVMQTAKMGSCGKRLELLIDNENQEAKDYLVILYFREVDDEVQVGERVFDIYVNGELLHPHFDILANGTEQYKLLSFQVLAVGGLNISLEGTSKFSPICNAYEAYEIITKKAGTAENDVSTLVTLRDALLESNPKLLALESWSGDPCLPILENGQSTSWVGVTCKSDQGRQIVTELDLSGKNLQGQMPSSINNLVNLEKLNISDNKLEGSLPELPNLMRLTSLDIRRNNFKGNFPKSIRQLANLTTLFIGCNPQLNTSIPEGCLKCNNSDEGCEGNSRQKNTPTVVIGGFVGGSVFLVVTVGVMFSCFYRRRKPVDADQTPNYKENSIKSFNIEIFTLKALASATNNYEIKIGEGGFGAVYRGTLANGQEVAVKVRSTTSIQGMREFETELNLLSKTRHENLVPLLGFCPEKDQQILVYPFMSNGSLQDRLYGEAAKRKPLDWQTRISIALGAARGLHFLHTGGERCIIHRDIKSSNILLDQSMVAKVADFGFSKYAPQDGDTNVSLEVRGTAGYLDPEYYSSQQLTVKSDVFSFGVVLLEIICGREPLNIHRPRSEWSLVEWAKPFIQESNIDAIVDPVIRTSYAPEAMWRVVETAMTSVEPFSVRRPSMEDIVRELEDAFIIENNASQYMKSISGSFRFSMDPKSLPSVAYTPNEPSSVFSETLGSPHPR